MRLHAAQAALLLLCVARLWVMPLPSSFWVDEMGTEFVVRHGANEPSLRAAPQVPASIYYHMPRAMDRVFGASEIAYRLPSLLAMAIALWLIARIAGRLIHPDAAWFAAFACMALRGFNYQAADARPYALGTLVTAAAMWFLMRWLDSGRWLQGVMFAAAAALLWRVHLIYWPMYLAFGLYALARLWRGDTRAGWMRAAIVFSVGGIALLPVVSGALALYRNAGAHVVAAPPSAADLIQSLKLGLVTAVCAGAAILGRWLRWPAAAYKPSAGAGAMILGWWLAQPVGLFLFSWISRNSVFVPRYLYVSLAGAALAATAAAAAFLPAAKWRPASLALGAGVLLITGGWNHLWPAHHPSDWRGAAREVNALAAGDAALPVICPSPFIEARPPVWSPAYPVDGFLYSHLAAYPIRGRIYPFPFDSPAEAQAFGEQLLRQTLAPAARFVIYGGNGNTMWWRDWFAARPELAAWEHRESRSFGDVAVVLFEAPPSYSRRSAVTGSTRVARPGEKIPKATASAPLESQFQLRFQ